MSQSFDSHLLEKVRSRCVHMTQNEVAKSLDVKVWVVTKALRIIRANGESPKMGMDNDVHYFYSQGMKAAMNGLSEKDCPHDYASIKAYCAWMGGYNDHKTTRKI